MVIILVAGLYAVMKMNNSARSAELPVYGMVNSFSLIDQDDQTITEAALDGDIWITDFIFTRCQGPCPKMTGKMYDLQNKFSDYPDVKFLSISVDPEYDTPDVLTAYAEKFDADVQRWRFLTGEKKAVRELAISSLKLNLIDGTENQSIIHSTRFVLIDKKRQIRGYYDSNLPDEMSRLVSGVEQLRREDDLGRRNSDLGFKSLQVSLH